MNRQIKIVKQIRFFYSLQRNHRRGRPEISIPDGSSILRSSAMEGEGGGGGGGALRRSEGSSETSFSLPWL